MIYTAHIYKNTQYAYSCTYPAVVHQSVVHTGGGDDL